MTIDRISAAGAFSMSRVVFLSTVAFLLAACANEAVIEYDSETDFSKFHTFAWRDSGEDLSDLSPEWHARIVNGIKTRLTTTGFREVDNNPDVYVTYYSAESQETFVVTNHMGYGWGSNWHGSTLRGMGKSEKISFDIGTLIVDLWDAHENKLVWRATASDTISEIPEQNKEMLNQMLDSMVEQWHKEQAKSSMEY